MRQIPQAVACLLLLGLLPAIDADAGWVIEQVMRPGRGGDQDRQVLTISANRMKATTLDRAGKPAAAWITDLEAQRLTTVDYEKRTAATGTVREYAEAMRGATQAAGGQMGEAMEGLPGCGRNRRAGMDPSDPTWRLASEGYPVRTVEHGEAAGTVVEVVKAESRGVLPAEFQPPAGFKRQTLKELMTGR